MYGSGINLYPYYKSTGILAALKKINFSAILNGTQKTLNVVNQALPIVYQIKPIVNNAKTVFKIIGAVKDDTKTNNNKNNNNIQKATVIKEERSTANYVPDNTGEPNFFI